MGTRADFYVGTGDTAEWLGSLAWDGYEFAEDEKHALRLASSEAEFRVAVEKLLDEREDGTEPKHGWPWPWDDSGLTDYVYYWADEQLRWNDRSDWPNMKDKANINFGKCSGIIILGR